RWFPQSGVMHFICKSVNSTDQAYRVIPSRSAPTGRMKERPAMPTVDIPPVRLPSIDALSDPDALAAVVGPVASIERSPLVTLGYTNTANTLERLDLRLASGGRRSLVLKRTATMLNWVERRSRDAVCREAALLAEPALSGVWKVLGCPYRAFAAHGGDA